MKDIKNRKELATFQNLLLPSLLTRPSQLPAVPLPRSLEKNWQWATWRSQAGPTRVSFGPEPNRWMLESVIECENSENFQKIQVVVEMSWNVWRINWWGNPQKIIQHHPTLAICSWRNSWFVTEVPRPHESAGCCPASPSPVWLSSVWMDGCSSVDHGIWVQT